MVEDHLGLRRVKEQATEDQVQQHLNLFREVPALDLGMPGALARSENRL